jgi:hypothetical protein
MGAQDEWDGGKRKILSIVSSVEKSVILSKSQFERK